MSGYLLRTRSASCENNRYFDHEIVWIRKTLNHSYAYSKSRNHDFSKDGRLTNPYYYTIPRSNNQILKKICHLNIIFYFKQSMYECTERDFSIIYTGYLNYASIRQLTDRKYTGYIHTLTIYYAKTIHKYEYHQTPSVVIIIYMEYFWNIYTFEYFITFWRNSWR